MYIVKNAINNLFRNKGRNIFLFLIFLIIILASSIGIIIHNTMKEIIMDYSSRFEVTGFLKADYFSFLGEASSNGLISMPDITAEDYESYADSKYVKSYYAYGETPVHVDGLLAVGEEDNSEDVMSSIVQDPDGLDSIFYDITGKLSGYTDLSLLTDFIEGNRKIVEGKVFELEDECIISEGFAEINHLKVGDQITTKLCRIDAAQEITLKITGIYRDSNQYGNSASADTNPLNNIITNYDTLAKFSSDYYDVQVQFVLTSPEVIGAFEKELVKKGLPDGYYLSTNEQDYNSIVAPVKGLKKITQIFLGVVLLLGVIILVITVLLSVKERKNEIGVLRARGMTKSKILLQFISENSILVIICLTIGLSSGTLIARPISNILMEDQIKLVEEQKDEKKDQYQSYFYSDEQSVTSFGNKESSVSMEDITISLTKDTILQIVFVAFLMCALSSSIGLVYVNRFEPMKILSERD